MGCDTDSYRKNYEFFNSIDVYLKYDDLTEINGTNEISGLKYDFINKFNEKKFVDLKKLCNRFVYLVDALRKRNEGATFNAHYDFDYLNYWLNARIHEIEPESICKKQFFQNLRAESNEILKYSELSSGIYDIQAEDLDNLNTLYNLYKSFKELNKSINLNNPQENTYMEYAKNCVQHYQKLKDRCIGDDAKFCEILRNFKIKYEAIDLCEYTFEGKTRKKLPSLESDPDKSAEDCQIPVNDAESPYTEDSDTDAKEIGGASGVNVQNTTIGVFATLGLSFMYFIFYKFTSFGPWMHSRIFQKGKMPENLGEEIDHLSHTFENEHINIGNTAYKISYNSI
ncbi:PIR Superfamily Protein [Plasmodium ovale curtisi]|uniref:PIR Superfamily Protein n=1 Tax=Plasmodium ovale curtisi TaxID=864141 RepID=A0A1A8X7G3_PLAOA|nr:PIR Superfamily Protein [Plasmodium ovale curtisi]